MSDAERRVRDLAGARRAIEGFAADNRYQRQLQSLLIVMLDHMDGVARQPGGCRDLDGWWTVLRHYQRTLASPEMAGRRARTVLAKLVGGNTRERTQAWKESR